MFLILHHPRKEDIDEQFIYRRMTEDAKQFIDITNLEDSASGYVFMFFYYDYVMILLINSDKKC